MSFIKENLAEIRLNIEAAAKKSGRSAEDITLVAVTKTIEPERINEAIELGLNEFGENKVQELLSKYGYFKPEPEWHLIGNLQTNKVKSVIGKVKLIQSVDSLHLAEEINKRSIQADRITDVLIEINIAGEETKHGIEPAKTADFAVQMQGFKNIRLRGLMCIATYSENPEANRCYFQKMYGLQLDIQAVLIHNKHVNILSMGMSNDYVCAIEEGSTMVRIGTAVFGNRAG